MKPTQAQFTAYQQIFDYFNSTLFENGLPECILSFSRRRSSPHTLYTSGQWREATGTATHEISLNMTQLSRNEQIEEVMATLVREMVHLWQEICGKPSSKWYFNREWAEKMEEVGLTPTVTGLPGGKRTGQGVKHYIEPGGRFERAFAGLPESCLWPFRPVAFAGGKRKEYSDKEPYRCTGCGAKVWGKSGLELICGCGEAFAGKAGETKAGLREKVYRLLAGEFGAQGRSCLKRLKRR